MARTYHKSAMQEEISLFSTTALEELEFFNPLSLAGESEYLHEYDVYSCIEETKPPLSSLLAEDLLEELGFEDGGGLLDSDWMTEKLEFDTTDAVLAVQTTDPLMDLDEADLTALETSQANEPVENAVLEIEITPATLQSEDNIFAGVDEILKRLCADRQIPFNEGNASPPSSPLQNVPEVEVHSPCSVASLGSEISEEALAMPQLDGETLSCPSSPDIQVTPVKKSAPTIFQAIKTPSKASYFSPYPKEKPVKVKTTQQKKRKRDQNKDAATRYRIKKREEQETIQKELSGLEKENVELKDQVTSLSKEMEYLKNLMLEVYKNKLQKQAIVALNVK